MQLAKCIVSNYSISIKSNIGAVIKLLFIFLVLCRDRQKKSGADRCFTFCTQRWLDLELPQARKRLVAMSKTP